MEESPFSLTSGACAFDEEEEDEEDEEGDDEAAAAMATLGDVPAELLSLSESDDGKFEAETAILLNMGCHG